MTVEDLIEKLKQFPLYYTVVFEVIGDDDTECKFNAEHGVLTLVIDIEPRHSIIEDYHDDIKDES